MPQCPSHEKLDQLLGGKLNDADEDSVCTHVEACIQCQTRLEEMVRDADSPKWSVLGNEISEVRATGGFLNRLKTITPPAEWSDTAWNSPAFDSAPSDAIRPQPPEPGAHSRPHLIPGYEVLNELGRGGMGVVYKARQVGLNRFVALKMPLAGEHADLKQLARFRAEADAIARLHHPNIVQIYEVGEQEGRPFLAIELVEGGSLDEHLRATPQPARAAAELLLALAEAIAYAHEHGVVHRDLKPANVLLEAADGGERSAESQKNQAHTGRHEPAKLEDHLALCPPLSALRPKITDFGLAKLLAEETGPHTHTGAILGTPSYMAPEQAAGQSRRFGPSCDIYSLGAILYEMLTGRPPFRAETPIETLQQVLAAEPLPLSQFRLRVPRDLETICLKCLQKEPARRYASARALAEDLRRFLSDQPIQARRTSAAERTWRWCRRNRALATLVAAVTFLLISSALGASIAAALWRHQRDEEITARNHIAEAERQKTDKLWESLLANAQSVRSSDTAGRRFDGLRFIREAAAIRPDPRLRTEAIACLALLDLRPIEPWQKIDTLLGSGIGVDHALERYAAHDSNGHVLIRRVADNRVLDRLPDPEGVDFWHFGAEFSPDGRFIIATYVLRGTGLRCVVRDLERRQNTLDTNRILSWTPSSKLIAYNVAESTPGLIDAATGREESQLVWQKPQGSGLFVDPSERLVAIRCDSKREVWIAELASGRVRAKFAQPTGSNQCAWRPDGRLLAVAGGDGRVYVYDTVTGREQSVLEGHRSDVISVRFSPNGHLLMSWSWDGTTRLWDPVIGRSLLDMQGVGLEFSSDGLLVAAIRQGRIGRWELAGIRECRRLHHGQIGNRTDWVGFRGPMSVSFSPDGRLLASASGDGVRLFDVGTGDEISYMPIGACDEVLFHPTTGDFYTSGQAGLYRWPVRSKDDEPAYSVGPPQRVENPDFPSGQSSRASWGANGRTLVVAQRRDRRALLLPLDGSRPTRLDAGGEVVWSALSPDGRWAAAGLAYERDVVLWDVKTGQQVRRLPSSLEQKAANAAVVFSPDGRWLVTAGQHEYLFWHCESWELGPTVPREQPESWPHPPAFSPDGRLAALELSPQRIVLVDPASAEITSLTPPDPQAISHLAWSADGNQLAVARMNHTIELWDLYAIRYQLAELDLDWGQSQYPPLVHFDSHIARVKLDLQLDATTLAARAQFSLDRKDYQQAIADFRQSVAIDPDQPLVCNSFAWTLVTAPPELRDPEQALPLAERAVAESPNTWPYQNTLAVVYFRLGKFRQAVEKLEFIAPLRRGPQQAVYDLYFLAMSYHGLGAVDKSVECFLRAVHAQSEAELSPREADEIHAIRAEAESVLGKQKSDE